MLNKELTASRGINMSKYVQSVNGVTPDDSGNVEVNATPPSISVGATTLAAGSTATVTKTGTDEAPVFTFGIPKGEKGDKGDTGPQGPAGSLTTTGVTAGAVGPTADATFSEKELVSVLIPYFSVDKYGRVLTTASRNIKFYAGSCSQCSVCSNCSDCGDCNDHP